MKTLATSTTNMVRTLAATATTHATDRTMAGTATITAAKPSGVTTTDDWLLGRLPTEYGR